MPEPHPLDRLFAVIQSRVGADSRSSYTAKLLAQGKLKIAKKLGEEAIETALAAVVQDKACLAAESVDLLYHLVVLWVACGVEPAEIYRALDARAGCSGLEEKASREV